MWSGQFASRLGRFGYPFHVALACLWCMVCVGPVFAVEMLGWPVLVCYFLRLPFVWRSVPVVIKQPEVIALFVMIAWALLGVLWSPDRAGGWHELGNSRWLWTIFVLWPVLDQRRLLIGFLALGFALAHLAQCAELVGLRQSPPVAIFAHPLAPNPIARISGWWHQPTIGGVLCTAGVGLHLGPALLGQGLRRATGLLGASAATIAALATGSRGALLALVLLVPAVVILGVRAAPHRERRSTLARAVAACLAGLVVITLALAAMPTHRARTIEGWHHARAAITSDAINTDTGMRVFAANTALHEAAKSPLLGAGTGAFAHAARERAAHSPTPTDPQRLASIKTAHNTYLQALATNGVPGLMLLLITLALTLRAAHRWAIARPDRGTSHQPAPNALGTYSACLFSVLLALCPSTIPRTQPRHNTRA